MRKGRGAGANSSHLAHDIQKYVLGFFERHSERRWPSAYIFDYRIEAPAEGVTTSLVSWWSKTQPVLAVAYDNGVVDFYLRLLLKLLRTELCHKHNMRRAAEQTALARERRGMNRSSKEERRSERTHYSAAHLRTAV